MWKEILNTGGILAAVLIIGWVWVLTILRVWRELRNRRLPLVDRLFWISIAVALPLAGFVIYQIARQMEKVLMSDLPPKESFRPPVTLTHPPEDLPAELPVDFGGTFLPPEPAAMAAFTVDGRTAWRVSVTQGPEEGRQFRLDHLPALIGRGEQAEIRLDQDPAVSRQHAEFYLWEGTLRVRDLNSRHGTAVQGVLVTDAELAPGQLVRAGTSFLRIEPEERS